MVACRCSARHGIDVGNYDFREWFSEIGRECLNKTEFSQVLLKIFKLNKHETIQGKI